MTLLDSHVRFDKVSLTAKLTAYMRQYTDIPFAADVAIAVHAGEAIAALLRDHDVKIDDLLFYAPIFEVRYKSIAEVIRKSGVRQVLELASGLSLRGLAMTQDPEFVYVESDLEELTREKSVLVDALRRSQGLSDHGNFHLLAANALDAEALQWAAREHFRPAEPVAVVSEGLLQYLSATELSRVMGNVHEMLLEYGGIFVTPDFSLKSTVEDVPERRRAFRAIVDAYTERPLHANAFDDEAALAAFIASEGFRAEQLNQVDEARDVVSVDRAGLPPALLERAKPKLRLWILRLSNTANP